MGAAENNLDVTITLWFYWYWKRLHVCMFTVAGAVWYKTKFTWYHISQSLKLICTWKNLPVSEDTGSSEPQRVHRSEKISRYFHECVQLASSRAICIVYVLYTKPQYTFRRLHRPWNINIGRPKTWHTGIHKHTNRKPRTVAEKYTQREHCAKRHYPLGNHWHSGDNQSGGSSALVVSRWLWPGNKTFLEVASMVVTWWVLAFLPSGVNSNSG